MLLVHLADMFVGAIVMAEGYVQGIDLFLLTCVYCVSILHICTEAVKPRNVLNSVTLDELISVNYVLQDLIVHAAYVRFARSKSWSIMQNPIRVLAQPLMLRSSLDEFLTSWASCNILPIVEV